MELCEATNAIEKCDVSSPAGGAGGSWRCSAFGWALAGSRHTFTSRLAFFHPSAFRSKGHPPEMLVRLRTACTS